MTIKLPTEEKEKELWIHSKNYCKEAALCQKVGSNLAFVLWEFTGAYINIMKNN